MPTQLRRTIYIGAGGTGVQTVSQVRNYFRSLTSDGSLPPMIKCLFIDTDENQVQNLDKSIDDTEILSIAEVNAKPIYQANSGKYDTYTNMATIRALTNGAGQYRSHGRFAIMSKENAVGNIQNSFSAKFTKIYNDVMRIDANVVNPDFETMGNDVEIHLAFSMSGGTGAGTFLSLAYLIREIVPTCKIVAYAYAPSFFMDLPAKEQIQQNSYASLIELDYCMSSDHPEFQDIKYPAGNRINRAPFDAVMYIDNKTYTRNGQVRPYVYPTSAKEQVQKNVAYAMAISAGEMGAATRSVIDNLISDITGGQYDVKMSDSKDIKRGWVSSLGVSEICCTPNSEQTFFSNNLAIKLLKQLTDSGRAVNSASDEAFLWVKALDLNESQDISDQDAVINAMISPTDYKNKLATEIGQTSVGSGKSAYFARVEASLTEETLQENKSTFVSQKKQELMSKVQESIFADGVKAIPISSVLDILHHFAEYMKAYGANLGTEKQEFETRLITIQNAWIDAANAIKEVGFINRAAKIVALEGELRMHAQKEFECRCEIRRREKGIKAFEELAQYTANLEVALANLLTKVQDAIYLEEGKITAVNVMPIISDHRWGTIDLTKKVRGLKATKVENTGINLSNFFKSTGYRSILELANCDNLAGLAEKYAEQLFKENAKGIDANPDDVHPILRVLNSLAESERTDYLHNASMYSFPLMEIQNYGEEVKITEHIYVAVPGGAQCSPRIKKLIQDALKINVAPDWVDINDPNRILIYRQIGVIPPYFIAGISKGRNTIFNYASCQAAFEKKDDPRSYIPFTDKQFDDVYHKKGYSLERNKWRDGNIELLTWVQAIIFKLIYRTEEGLYKTESETGEVDINDLNYRKFRTLGANRFEAFNEFKNDPELYNEISRKISTILEDPQNVAKLSSYRGANRSNYGNEFIDRTATEFRLVEVQNQCTSEISIL